MISSRRGGLRFISNTDHFNAGSILTMQDNETVILLIPNHFVRDLFVSEERIIKEQTVFFMLLILRPTIGDTWLQSVNQ